MFTALDFDAWTHDKISKPGAVGGGARPGFAHGGGAGPGDLPHGPRGQRHGAPQQPPGVHPAAPRLQQRQLQPHGAVAESTQRLGVFDLGFLLGSWGKSFAKNEFPFGVRLATGGKSPPKNGWLDFFGKPLASFWLLAGFWWPSSFDCRRNAHLAIGAPVLFGSFSLHQAWNPRETLSKTVVFQPVLSTR